MLYDTLCTAWVGGRAGGRILQGGEDASEGEGEGGQDGPYGRGQEDTEGTEGEGGDGFAGNLTRYQREAGRGAVSVVCLCGYLSFCLGLSLLPSF